ncbi:TetR/AcrR family transcriptional regulator [Oerskovia flava]|uniref:TetR/AcrR family transcriptional regulator n=1 Tax=Oerskovia flava TaxID=2986422 RepID=UPI00223ED775|nr:TetR/AcrR family transcriptional regulator [Oerskovia sp. JB1-3-2]
MTTIALALVDDGGSAGFADLTLAKVAARAGVAAPSLYKHVGSLADLRREVATVAVGDLTRALAGATVGRAREDALRALAHATRDFAREHPGRYAAAQVAPDPDDPADAALSAAGGESVAVVVATLRGFQVPPARTIDAVRAVRAALHGFVGLESGGGFRLPDDLDQSFDTLVEMLVHGVTRLAETPRPAGVREQP